VSDEYQWKGDDKPPPFDQELADSFVGKYILIGITYCDHTGRELRRQQLHGVIESAGPEGFKVSLRGPRAGTSWNMPPDLRSISEAPPGTYRLRETKEEIENPDLMATWTITQPVKH
jgi:hypothetical protein